MGVTKGGVRSLDYSSCRYIVYTEGGKVFPYTYVGSQVYSVYLHGPFGLATTAW